MVKYFYLFILLIGISSCSSPTDESEYSYVGNDVPVIKGIIRTGSGSPEPIGIIGAPNEKSSIELEAKPSTTGAFVPNETRFYSPYPNPFDGLTILTFALSQNAYVKCWVVQGKLSEEATESILLYSNSYSFGTNNRGDKIILLSKELPAGNHQIQFWTSNLPDGAYRAYLQINDKLMWRNLLLINHK